MYIVANTWYSKTGHPQAKNLKKWLHLTVEQWIWMFQNFDRINRWLMYVRMYNCLWIPTIQLLCCMPWKFIRYATEKSQKSLMGSKLLHIFTKQLVDTHTVVTFMMEQTIFYSKNILESKRKVVCLSLWYIVGSNLILCCYFSCSTWGGQQSSSLGLSYAKCQYWSESFNY